MPVEPMTRCASPYHSSGSSKVIRSATLSRVSRYMWHHSAAMRPKLRHDSRRISRRSASDFSGKAIADLGYLGEEKLGIAVGDISGKGISAALLMATIHSAVRVYELGRMPEREELVAAGAAAMSASNRSYQNLEMTGTAAESPASVLSLLNRHLYHSTPPEKYATLFLGVYEGQSRSLTYSNGGHLPPLLIASDGTIRKLSVGGTVIGLFHVTC